MDKIWLVTQESNVDGEILFNVTPCATEEVAKKVFEQLKKEILTNGHFSTAQEYMEGGKDMDECDFSWEDDTDGKFFIEDLYDDYYEFILMYEKEIWK